MALTTTHDLVAPALPGAGDVVGDLPDALGVGDRRAAELLHDEAHAVNATEVRLRATAY